MAWVIFFSKKNGRPCYSNEENGDALKKISVMHVIKLGFAPVSFPPG